MNTLRDIITGQGSKFVLVTFVKKDKTIRDMLIQHAALKSRVKGEDASPSHRLAAETRARNHPNLLNTYDVDRRAIRSINLDTVLRVKCGSQLYKVNDTRQESLTSL